MNKHTPGPWIARQEYSNRWRIEVPRDGYVPRSVALVSTTILEMGGSDKNTGANAHLIAAAPELLAALEGLLSLDRYADAINIKMARKIARTAIAKAKGV